MARGEAITEPHFVAASRHAPTPVQAIRAFVSSGNGNLKMKLDLAVGCWSADVPAALVQRAEGLAVMAHAERLT